MTSVIKEGLPSSSRFAAVVPFYNHLSMAIRLYHGNIWLMAAQGTQFYHTGEGPWWHSYIFSRKADHFNPQSLLLGDWNVEAS